MNTRLALRIGMGSLFLAALPVFPAPVTFQVDMSAQTALNNFNPSVDTVSVAGDPINGWSTSASPLAPSPGQPAVWVGTFEVEGTAGATAQYKYVMTTSSGTTWEGSVGSGGATGNRTFTLADTEQTLPVVFFNNVTNSTALSVTVTFQVNLAVQIALGSFDPSSGTVTVAGEFNAWNATAFELTRSTTDPDVWTGASTLTGPADSTVSYKFVLNGGTWEGNVGPGGTQNRSVTLSGTTLTLPPVFFNNVTSAPSLVPVTFQVNLSVPIAQGTFDPETGTVSVAGDPLNAWDPAVALLTRSLGATNLWTGTFEVTTSVDATMLYKFVLNGSTWESIDNRTYTFASTNAQTVPVAYFNNLSQLGALTSGPPTGGQMPLSWTAAPGIRLQSATALAGGSWTDVAGTLGQGAAMVPVSSGSAFYRLAGP